MPGSTFRCQCKLCSEIFFGAARDTPYCSRCAKRIGYRPPRVEKPARPDPPPAALASEPASVAASSPAVSSPAAAEAITKAAEAPAAEGAGERPASGEAAADTVDVPQKPERKDDAGSHRGPGKRTPPAAPSANAPAPQPTAAAPAAPGEAKISDSLRHSVEHAYSYYAEEPDIALKEIIDKICLEFGLERRVVHEIVAPVHTSHIRQQSTQLTPQQRKEIGDRYQNMVLSGARPAPGRRKQIARDMALPANSVVAVVAQWAWNHHDPRELSREQKFQIEKSFWKYAGIGTSDRVNEEKLVRITDMNRTIAAELSFPAFAVARWIDQLHDDPRPMSRIPSVSEEVRDAIEAAYRVYLSADSPPADSLHRELSERFECTVRQAHKTLLLYRWRERLAHVESSPEEVEMVREALSNESRGPDDVDEQSAGVVDAENGDEDPSGNAGEIT
ncbi:MAG: hypothetical protein M3Y56_07650 [Armatimonadota bacterium]|nr:hypothetical protein [Armatimonadota bacterium]